MQATQIKIVDILPQLNFLDIASVIHCASEAIRHSCGFGRCYADLGLRITLLANEEEDCDWLADNVADIHDQSDLVSLIVAASYRLQTLNK